MAMTLLSRASGGGDLLFYTTEFRKVLEDHIPYLRTHPSTSRKVMSIGDTERYKWNISAYIATLVPAEQIWLTMRLSGYLDDLEFDGSNPVILVAGTTAIDDLVKRYLEKLAR